MFFCALAVLVGLILLLLGMLIGGLLVLGLDIRSAETSTYERECQQEQPGEKTLAGKR